MSNNSNVSKGTGGSTPSQAANQSGQSAQGSNAREMSAQGSDRETQGSQGRSQELGSRLGSGEGSQLEQFSVFLKENWKPILTELVAAGVTAYLTHDSKARSAKADKESKKLN